MLIEPYYYDWTIEFLKHRNTLLNTTVHSRWYQSANINSNMEKKERW